MKTVLELYPSPPPNSPLGIAPLNRLILDDKQLMWEHPERPTAGAQMVVFWNSQNVPCLVVDCLSQTSSRKKNKFHFEITIRCFLNNDGKVLLSSDIGRDRHGNVSLDLFFSHANCNLHVNGSPEDLIETLSRKATFSCSASDQGSFVIGDSKFNPTSPLKIGTRTQHEILTLSFERSAHATTFAAPPNIKELVSGSLSLNIVQDHISSARKDKAFPLSLHKWCVSIANETSDKANDFIREWNTRVAEPFILTKDLSGGPIPSTIPTLEGPRNPPAWRLRIQDTATIRVGTLASESFYVVPFGATNLPPDKIVIASGGVQPSLASVGVRLTFASMQSHEKRPLTSAAKVVPCSDDQTIEWSRPESQFILEVGLSDPVGDSRQEFRIGSLDFSSSNDGRLIQAAKFLADLEAEIAKPSANNKRPSVAHSFSSTLTLRIDEVHPGGQDFLPEDLFVPENFDENEDCDIKQAFIREVPLAIEWIRKPSASSTSADSISLNSSPSSQDSNTPQLKLEIKENARVRQNRTLRMSLQTTSSGTQTVVAGGSSNDRSVIVLDRNPFVVAEVEFPSFTQQHPGSESAIVAQWTNAQTDGPSWAIQPGPDQTMELIFPSQSTGETIAKGNSLQDDQLVETRLSPPTRLSMFPSFFQQRYVEVPWNLRRILGYPGQRAPGVGIKQLQYELLYGLSCSTDYPYLRLAEIWSLLGQIPGRMRPGVAWTGGEKESDRYYDDYRRRWSQIYKQYLNRLAVYEPWDSHQPGSLTLNERIRCEIRESADLKRPVEGPACEVLPGHRDFGTSGMLGGAIGAFESRNVYCALMRNPKSTGAQLVEPLFSAYGGFGTTMAEFDNGLTRISAHIIAGRAESYTLERFGRIGVFWNNAKHVIIYERTVAPSEQFPDTRLKGRPVLRKVREYIEILETVRRYPEKDTPPATRGFIANCDFGKNAVIPVDGRWGTDVASSGWKIPLWNPATQTDAAQKDVYKKPNISLGALCDENKKSIVLPQRLEEPEKLFFFTNTAIDAARETDNWQPVPGIDYVDLASPAPPQARWQQDGSADVLPPQRIAAGFEAFTYHVCATSTGANVVADRSQQAVSAVIENVTMMRAKAQAVPDTALTKFEKPALDSAAKLLTDIRRIYKGSSDLAAIQSQLSQAWTDSKIPQITSNFTANALKQAGLDCAPQEPFQTCVCRLLGNQTENTVQQFLTSKVLQGRSFVDTLLDWQGQLSQFFDRVALDLGRQSTAWSQDSLKEAISHEFQEFEQRLLWYPLSPEPIQKVANAVVEWNKLWLVVVAEYDKRRAAAIYEVKSIKAGALNLQDLAKAQALVAGLKGTINTYLTNLKQTIEKAVPQWLPVVLLPTSKAQGLLQKLLVPLDTLATRIDNCARKAAQQANAIPQITQEQLLAVLNELPRGDDLKFSIDLTKWQSAAKSLFSDWLDSTLKPVEGAILAKVPSTLDTAKIKALASDSANILKDKIGGTIGDIASNWKTIGAQIKVSATSICDQLTLDSNIFPDWTSSAPQEVEKCLDMLNQKMQEGLATAGDWLQHLGQQVNNLQVPDFALGLVRAFGKPPAVPGLDFNSDSVAYFFNHLNPNLDMSPVLASVDSALGKLKAFGLNLPSVGLSDQLIPAALQQFDLASVFRNFAGLDLGNMFTGLRLPETASSGVHVRHGADPQSRRAWVEADIDVPISNATLFSFVPLQVDVVSPQFKAHARFEVTPDGVTQRVASGTITADWVMRVGGAEIVTFRQTRLLFDEQGNVRFDIAAKNVQLAPVMSFLNSVMQTVPGSGTGFSVRFIPPAAAEARLDLALPAMNFGTVGIANLSLAAGMKLDALDDFSIGLTFSLGRRQTPFTLTIFILGGSGYIDTSLVYHPLSKTLACHVDIGLMASASLAIALGPIRGGVFIYLGVTAAFDSGGSTSRPLTIGIVLLMRGDVCLLGIVQVNVSLLLEAQYDGSTGVLRGHGHLDVSIKICWCFTLNISADVSYDFRAGGFSNNRMDRPEVLLASNFANGNPLIASDVPVFALPVQDRSPNLVQRCDATDPLNPPYFEDFMSMLEF
jgi:hypothetical protein